MEVEDTDAALAGGYHHNADRDGIDMAVSQDLNTGEETVLPSPLADLQSVDETQLHDDQMQGVENSPVFASTTPRRSDGYSDGLTPVGLATPLDQSSCTPAIHETEQQSGTPTISPTSTFHNEDEVPDTHAGPYVSQTSLPSSPPQVRIPDPIISSTADSAPTPRETPASISNAGSTPALQDFISAGAQDQSPSPSPRTSSPCPEPYQTASMTSPASTNLSPTTARTMASVQPASTVQPMPASMATPITVTSSPLSSAPPFAPSDVEDSDSEEDSDSDSNDESSDEPWPTGSPSSMNSVEGSRDPRESTSSPGSSSGGDESDGSTSEEENVSVQGESSRGGRWPTVPSPAVAESSVASQERRASAVDVEGDREEEEEEGEAEEEKEDKEHEHAEDGAVYEVPVSPPARSPANYTPRSADEQSSPVKTTRRSAGRKVQTQKSANPDTTSVSTNQSGQRKPPQHPDSNEEMKQEIVQSYQHNGLKLNIHFAATKEPYDPMSITIAGRWREAKLTEQTMQKLRAGRDKVLRTHWVTADNADAVCSIEKRDTDLIRKLCNSPTSHTKGPGLSSAMHKFCTEGNTTHDQMRLFDFFKWSVLIVGRQEDVGDEVG